MSFVIKGKKDMIIGYQGTKGSFSEVAMRHFVSTEKLPIVEVVDGQTSKSTILLLKNRMIDYAVVAFENNNGGLVKETHEWLSKINFEKKAEFKLDVSQCAFVKDSSVQKNDVRVVASHPQAIRQCKESLNRYFPSAQFINYGDTASAARDLRDGHLSELSVVLCSKKAGLENGLHLLEESINDNKKNVTTFHLIRLID